MCSRREAEEDSKGAEDSKGVEGSIEGSIDVTDASGFCIIFYFYDTLCVVCGKAYGGDARN
jgi:hypothetical protein